MFTNSDKGVIVDNDIKNQIVEQARYKMSLDLSVPVTVINTSTSLALKDKYLYDLMNDWLKENNDYIKSEMLKEIVNYTDEMLRTKKF